MNEYDGGTIDNRCPDCGQFCKEPETYKVSFDDKGFIGAFAKSFCKRCKKEVMLPVEFN